MSVTQLPTDGTIQLDTGNTGGLLDVAPSTTTLAAAVTTTAQTAITLTSGTLAVNGAYIRIGTESMLVASGGGTASLVVERGANGTTAATYAIAATVNLPGKVILLLLPNTQTPNVELFIRKTSADINYVEVAAAAAAGSFPGNTFPGGGSSLLLPDNSARGTAHLKFPRSGLTLIVLASGGAMVGPAGPGGAGGTPPAQATLVVSSEKAVARTAGAYGQTGLIVTTTVTAAIGNTATYLQAWLSKDAGASWAYQGPFPYSITANVFEFKELAPTIAADGTASPKWLVKVLLSNTSATSDPAVAVLSSGFTVAEIALAGASICSNAHLGTASYTADADGNWSFAVPVSWDIAVSAEIWTTQLQVRNVDGTHAPMPGQWGEWRVVGEQDHPGTTVTENNIAGWPVLDAAFQYKYYEFRLRARSRAGTDATAWVVQSTCWTGAAYLDFAATVQAGAIPPTRFAAGAIPVGVTLPTTQLTGTVTATQIGSVNASTITGSITASQIGSVNATAITGVIVAAQIGSVNATAISGLVTAAQITSVNATAISGLILAAQIGTLTAGQVTGLIVSSQLSTGIINSASLLASAFFGNGITNNGTTITITPSTMLSGTWTAGQIGSVNAGAIVGSIVAGQIASVNAVALVGTISSTQIGSINAATITIGLVGPTQISSVNAAQLNVGTINVGAGGMTFSGTGGIKVNDGSGNVVSILWQTLTSGYGVGVNGNFSANGTMFCTGTFWSLSRVTGNTLAIYNSGIGTVDVVDNGYVFVGRGVNCPSYNIVGTNYYIGGTLVINSLGVFVGLGITIPSYGISCAGVNPYLSGAVSSWIPNSGFSTNQPAGQYFGKTAIIGLERAWGAGGMYLHFVGGMLVSIDAPTNNSFYPY